jgi:hypothetical protein
VLAHCPPPASFAATARGAPPNGGEVLVDLEKMLNPLRSEREAFRFLIYVIVAAAAVIALVLLARAIF